jgi:hypothetical protein
MLCSHGFYLEINTITIENFYNKKHNLTLKNNTPSFDCSWFRKNASN